MKRTQIQLSKEQAEKLAKIARLKKLSIAEIIRRSVELYLRMLGVSSLEEIKERAIAASGKFSSGESNISSNHDDYLSRIYKK